MRKSKRNELKLTMHNEISDIKMKEKCFLNENLKSNTLVCFASLEPAKLEKQYGS